jgi:hypothetical protein
MTISLSGILLVTALAQQAALVPTTAPRNELERLILVPGNDAMSGVQAWLDAHADDPDALQGAMTLAGFGPRRDDPECWFRRYERVVATDGLRIMASIRFCDGQKPFAFVLKGYPYPARAPGPGKPSGILDPTTKK